IYGARAAVSRASTTRGRSPRPRVGTRVAASGQDAQALQEVRPPDGVLRGLARGQAAVLELDERAGAARREADDQARGARRHLLVAGLAPGDLDEARPLDAHEAAADDDAVDVDREQPAVAGLEPRDVAHPAHEQLGPHEVVEDRL